MLQQSAESHYYDSPFNRRSSLMSALFKKLNLSTQSIIHVLNAPASFEPELAALAGITVKRAVAEKCGFAIAFVICQSELDEASKSLANACAGDAALWLAYPKGTSKKYKCEFNRDSGWSALGAAGFEPVRMIAIDADWSALRFRRVEHINKMARNPDGAISTAGRTKALNQKNTLNSNEKSPVRVVRKTALLPAAKP